MQSSNEQAAQILGDLGGRPVASIAYPTACAARLTNEAGEPMFPQTWEWLREHQHRDGSWGGTVLNEYDRLVSTAAAVLALREVGVDWSERDLHAGLDYLGDHVTD